MKLSQYPVATSIASGDFIPLLQSPIANNSNKTITRSNLEASLTRFPILTPGSDTANLIQPSADWKGLIIKGSGSQSKNLLEFQLSTGVQTGAIGPNGELYVGATKPFVLNDGQWFTEAVPYLQPTAAGGMAFDIMPKGGAGSVWIDIVSDDVAADITHYETLKLYKGANADAYISATAAGSGTVRNLGIQTVGGNVTVGSATQIGNRFCVLSEGQAGGVSLQAKDNSGSMAYNFRNESGVAKAYLAYVNHAQDWDNSHLTLPGDMVLRTEDNTNGHIYFITQAGALIAMKISRLGAVSIAGAVGFNGTAPLAKPLLATGVGHSADDIITVLQNYGLVKQS